MLDRIRIPSLGEKSEIHVTKSYACTFSQYVGVVWVELTTLSRCFGVPYTYSRAVMSRTSKLEGMHTSFETA